MVRTKTPKASKKPPKKLTKLQRFNSVADNIAGWEPGRDVLTPVRSVRTLFPQFNVASRVKGYPIQRVCMVHGPSNQGKTFFMLGLGKSFLAAGHFYFHVDAEFSTPQPWVEENLREFANVRTFKALRPKHYEQVADMIRGACDRLTKAKTAGDIPPETSAFFGIDSIQKLIPKNYREKLAELGGLDPRNGMGGMHQAHLHAIWMKELIPMMYHANAGTLLVSRESENKDAKTIYDLKYKVGGGTAPYFDSSMVFRVTRKAWVTVGSEKSKVIIGEKAQIQIVKTKVGHKDDKTTKCYFHTSNGEHILAGFDQARDVIEMGLDCGVLTKDSGHRINDVGTGEDYGQINVAVKALTDDPETLGDLCKRCEEVAEPEEEVLNVE